MSGFERIQQSTEQTSNLVSLPLPSSIRDIQALNNYKATDTASQSLPITRLGFPDLDIAPRKNSVEVKPGDTLWGIAKDVLSQSGRQFSQSDIKNMIDDICRKNNIQTPDKIHPGDKLVLPNMRNEGSVETRPRVKEMPRDFEPEVRKPIKLESKPQLSQEEMESDALSRHFDKIDKDKNDRISKEELKTYTDSLRKQLLVESDPAKARQLKQDIMSLDSAAKNFDTIKNKSKDEWLFESGISRRDVAKHAENPLREAIEEKNVLQRHFNKIDGDMNDRISKQELQDYINKLKIDQQKENDPVARKRMEKDLQVLNRIAEKKFDTIKEASLDDFFWEKGISRRDLENHVFLAEFPELKMKEFTQHKDPFQDGGWKAKERYSPDKKTDEKLSMDQYINLL